MAEGILVFADQRDGKLLGVTSEVLGAATRLVGQVGGKVSVALVGSGVSGLATELTSLGADRVYVSDDPSLEKYHNKTYVQALDAIVGQADPAVILFGKSLVSLDLAPRFAFHKDVGLANDVIDLRVDSGKVVATRPVYGGNALADVQPEGTPQIFSVRAKTQDPAVADSGRSGEVINVPVSADAGGIKVVDQQKQASTGPRLQDASRIVSGGRGIGEATEGWDQLRELAGVIGGAVGASRAAVDAGWVPSTMQIGLTGITVSPELYIAVAISGAVQHMAGCSTAKTIVAINKDKDAAIFKQARFGVEGDWKKILPALTAELKAMV
jgi:electron transfer flavoprotein alpha subunit